MIVNFSYFPACTSGQEIKVFNIQINKLGSTHYCFFSKILTISASVGSSMQHLLLSLWTQPEKELALLHFLALYLKSF